MPVAQKTDLIMSPTRARTRFVPDSVKSPVKCGSSIAGSQRRGAPSARRGQGPGGRISFELRVLWIPHVYFPHRRIAVGVEWFDCA